MLVRAILVYLDLQEGGLARNEIWLIIWSRKVPILYLLSRIVSRVYDTLVTTLAQNTNVISCLFRHARNLSLSSVSRIRAIIIIFDI